MRIFILLITTIVFVGCTPQQDTIDFQQVLEEAHTRANQGKSLSEDTLLVQVLEHYKNMEPRDTTKLHQATILTTQIYDFDGGLLKTCNTN